MEALEDADTQEKDALFKQVGAYKTNVWLITAALRNRDSWVCSGTPTL
jgi:hypothetical protein